VAHERKREEIMTEEESNVRMYARKHVHVRKRRRDRTHWEETRNVRWRFAAMLTLSMPADRVDSWLSHWWFIDLFGYLVVSTYKRIRVPLFHRLHDALSHFINSSNDLIPNYLFTLSNRQKKETDKGTICIAVLTLIVIQQRNVIS